MSEPKKPKTVHQVRLWGTPFTLTYRQYRHTALGDVHSHGVVVHRNINLETFLSEQTQLRQLARQVANKATLRAARDAGLGFVPAKRRAMGAMPTPGHPVQPGYVVTEEEAPMRFVEENGCLRVLPL